MDLTPAERASCVARYLAKKRGITQAEVGKLIGYSNRTAFSAVLTGQKRMPKKFALKLAELDPDINPDFLDGTSDEMILTGEPQPAAKRNLNSYVPQAQHPEKQNGIFIPMELMQFFSDLTATVRRQQDTILGQQDTINNQQETINQQQDMLRSLTNKLV